MRLHALAPLAAAAAAAATTAAAVSMLAGCASGPPGSSLDSASSPAPLTHAPEPLRTLLASSPALRPILDRAAEHPEIVTRLELVAAEARQSLGDDRLGVIGTDIRPVGRVDAPVPLTRYDPTHPYDAAEYDLPDRG